ncbi:ABC transporter substrate-binding protein [Laribacter hongkongensis]|uniref:ABC transporter substrate-binding protein n=1 Tax=Laribacter hongkongensis TaxID=168471 RepID=UPI001EFE04C5|nr:ABC transporter substrate-binding protein [Laribacter hongkongensis]MCG8995598.1 ABC transporter substrate-binding protein [Laribacter hongkongensis]MCG9009330.1 ABC transporter substrate-binding protein [Laribacter hongkongensis]MCG9022643.1 ABC transporter substrate-binding protein [Laribacter hongkongensis]MCG9045616.1 ABC transporter substrate-binding protein [Laribacter hongkongensis]MCG9075042.1 ABC transporter substrate-binding protein [Laribacter hongkongensis]
MKRRNALSLIACGLMAAFAPLSYANDVKSVGVTAIVDHPALDDVRKGVEDELKAQGFVPGKNLKYQFQSAQGNTATAGQIARKFVGDKVDAIVAIATPSAQAAVAASRGATPVVFAAVTDPVAAKLVKSWNAGNGNVTGVSDKLAIPPQVDLILKVKPGIKKVGMVYSPGEVNSVMVAKELKAELGRRGMTLVEAPAPRTVDVGPAAKSLVGKVDALYTSTDNNVVSTYESLANVANVSRIPLIASDTDSVERGAIAALGQSYYDMGRQTGKIVVRILKGEKTNSIAPQLGEKLSLVVNQTSAQKQGAPLSDALKQEAKTVLK